MSDMGLAIRLRIAREKMNMSQTEAAKQLGLDTPEALAAIEQGKAAPSLEQIKAMCVLYHVTADRILFDEMERAVRPATWQESLRKLAEAAAQLKMGFAWEKGENKGVSKHYLCLDAIPEQEYRDFLDKWIALWQLSQDGVIEYTEYAELLARRLDKLAE